MKVLLVCRLMSGFVSSVTSGRWQPSGSPAIHKLIEALDHEDDVRFVFTVKNIGWTFESDWQEPRDRQITVDGLAHPVLVLAGTAALPAWLGRWRGHVSDLHQAWRLFREIGRVRPEVVYLDRSNVFAAALIARFTRIPVVLRMLGVTPAMKQIKIQRAAYHTMLRWSYRAPFALVVCTMDGSGGGAWLAGMLRPGTPRCVLLNGVDPPRDQTVRSSVAAAPDTRLQVLFLGRLESLKRCREFIDALLSLSIERDRIHAIIVGAGNEEATLRALVEQAGAEDYITFLGVLPHDRIGEVLNQADVYVSLNRQGNLSNANLEAMTAGLCFVIPEADPSTGADIDTRDVIPEDAAIRIPQDRIVEGLAETLAMLAQTPQEVAARRAAMALAGSGLNSWAERIAVEMSMLAAVADHRPIPEAMLRQPAATTP